MHSGLKCLYEHIQHSCLSCVIVMCHVSEHSIALAGKIFSCVTFNVYHHGNEGSTISKEEASNNNEEHVP